ncbi:hypothetical protein KJ682_03910 [bacterium]|nr:hypothetical protein [bacterium]
MRGNWFNSLFVAAFVVVPQLSFSYEIPWYQSQTRPECIVIGKLTNISRDAFCWQREIPMGGPATNYLYDTGYIEIEKILYGKPEGLIPVFWMGRCRSDPPVNGVSVSCTLEMDLNVGDEYIWVVWALDPRFQDGRENFHSISTIWLSRLEETVEQIESLED